MTLAFFVFITVSALLALIVLSVGISTLIKMGVIANEASRPPHRDQGTYTLNQGREIRTEGRSTSSTR